MRQCVAAPTDVCVRSPAIPSYRSQVEKLLNPTNYRAVGASESAARGGFVDTETEVSAWMTRLRAALKNTNPAPVTVAAVTSGEPPKVIKFTIADFGAAGEVPPARTA